MRMRVLGVLRVHLDGNKDKVVSLFAKILVELNQKIVVTMNIGFQRKKTKASLVVNHVLLVATALEQSTPAAYAHSSVGHDVRTKT